MARFHGIFSVFAMAVIMAIALSSHLHASAQEPPIADEHDERFGSAFTAEQLELLEHRYAPHGVINRDRFLHALDRLHLDHQQRELAMEFHRDYWNHYMATYVHDLREYWALTGSRHADGWLDKLEEHRAIGDALRERQLTMEAALMLDVRGLLREEQRPHFPRLANARLREIWKPNHEGNLPDGNLDLIEIVAGLDLAPEERGGLDELLDQYEAELIPTMINLHVVYHEIETPVSNELLRYFETEGQMLTPDDWERRYTTLRAIMQDAAPRWMAVKHALRRLNLRYHEEIMQILPEAFHDEFHRRYNEVAYFLIHPDPTDARVLYDEVEAMEDLTDDQREVVAAFRERFERAHDALSRRMEEAELQRRIFIMSGRSHMGFRATPEEAERMNVVGLGMERITLNEAQPTVLRTVLDPEQFERLPQWSFERVAGVRPWAPTIDRRIQNMLNDEALEARQRERDRQRQQQRQR